MSAERVSVPELTLRMITEALSEQEFAILPLRVEDLLRLEQLDWIHRDPFDRVMIAQALEQDIPMVTAGKVVRRYPLRTIW